MLWRFPRTRGDGPLERTSDDPADLFPPHSRGWTRHSATTTGATTVSPALAGMDPASSWRTTPIGGFPRTRGDGPDADLALADVRQFPPHSRGWTRDRRHRLHAVHVSPALAGMDPARSPASFTGDCFPRTRGDGPQVAVQVRAQEPFPPHSRGWTSATDHSPVAGSVSPAHAGTTQSRMSPDTNRGAGPKKSGQRRLIPTRSEPHTRRYACQVWIGTAARFRQPHGHPRQHRGARRQSLIVQQSWAVRGILVGNVRARRDPATRSCPPKRGRTSDAETDGTPG